jgi:hypothetical protein
MKKVIDGKLYNTDTAKKLGYWSNRYNIGDLNYCAETLYKTKSGKYFIHGEGGANTRYAQPAEQNWWTAGEHIEPISEKTAKEWAEEHLNANEYISIFGQPEEV